MGDQRPILALLLASAAALAGWFARDLVGSESRADPSSGLRSEAATVQDSDRTTEAITRLTQQLDQFEKGERNRDAQDRARWTTLQAELETIQVQLRTQANRAASPSGGASPSAPPVEPDHWPKGDAAAIAKIRERWKSNLAELETRLLGMDPAGEKSTDLAMWSRFDDLKKARAALEAAQDDEALRSLSQSEFAIYFLIEVPRRGAGG